MEIGSEFWLNDTKSYSMENEIPAWLNKYGKVTLTMSGRAAISLLIDQLKLNSKKVLLPSYICESVILPFKEAEYEIIYYDIDRNLNPTNLDLIRDMDDGLFFHMGYYGFQTNKELVNIISDLRKNSVVIIEDVTHTLFSDFKTTFNNDYVIGSIRKWFGTPTGGFLSSNNKIELDILPDEEFIELRKKSLKQKYDYITSTDESLKNEFLEGFGTAEELLDFNLKPQRIDGHSENIIKNINSQELVNSRRMNFEYLLEKLRDVEGIEFIFDELNRENTPIFFPLYIQKNRDGLRQYLVKKEIYCPIHWPIPALLDKNINPQTQDIYNTVLSIPCDQRYTQKDMDRVVTEITNYFNKIG